MRRILGGLLLGTLGVALSLVLLEGVVRFFSLEEAPMLVKDAVVGMRWRPSYQATAYSPSAGRTVHRRFNRLGYRGADWPLAKAEGVRRVAVLGDSFTASIALDDSETLPAVLESLLNADGAGRWDVLNFGVDAYSPAQSLLVWRTFARDFAPDVVVLCLFNGNDISDDDRRLTNYPRPYFHLDTQGQLVLDPLPPLFTASTHWLGEHSRLYVWQKKRVQTLINRIRGGATVVPGAARYFDPRPDQTIEGSWVLSERIVAQLADEVRAAGAQFILVSVPDLVQVRDADWQTAVSVVDPDMAARLQRDYPEQRLGDFARRQGILFVPLLEPLHQAASQSEVYLPDGHWNAAGTRIGAETLRAALPRLEARP